jgi:hypothetical protein
VVDETVQDTTRNVGDFFEPEPKPSVTQRIRSAFTDETGSIRNPLGQGETDLQRLGRLRESSAKINRMRPEALDVIEEYLDLQQGGQAAVGVNRDPQVVQSEALVIAKELGFEETGPALADRFREVLDARLDATTRQARKLDVN